jgi:hypothetical protein
MKLITRKGVAAMRVHIIDLVLLARAGWHNAS